VLLFSLINGWLELLLQDLGEGSVHRLSPGFSVRECL
jgi:hypothetical protein